MERIGNFLARGHDRLTVLASALAALGLAMIVGSYVFQVVSRYFFDYPTAWASDFVAYALCATVFLAMPQVTRDRGHVAVTILVDITPRPVASAAHVFASLLGFCCVSFATWISLQENIRQYTRNIHTLAIVPIPQWWVSSFITFGLGVSAFYFLRYAAPRYRAAAGLEIG